MEAISKAQFDLMCYSLGSINPDEWYRNDFVTYESSINWIDLRHLEYIGLMEMNTSHEFSFGGNIVFSVTRKGKEVIKDAFNRKVHRETKIR